MRCAVYARSKMLAEDEGESNPAPVKIFRVGLPREDTPYIASCGKHSLIIECGPTPWGLVRYDIVRLMQRCTGVRMKEKSVFAHRLLSDFCLRPF